MTRKSTYHQQAVIWFDLARNISDQGTTIKESSSSLEALVCFFENYEKRAYCDYLDHITNLKNYGSLSWDRVVQAGELDG